MKFVNDLKRYWDYTRQSAKAELKSEVASSYLNWLWWILDPLLFMMVYTFIAQVVFSSREQFFPIFVFIGLTMWSFFNKIVIGSVKIVRSNSAIVSKVYVPKYILVVQKMLVNGFKMAISFILVFVLMLIFRVPITWNILYIIPIVLILLVITFGVSNLMLHFGVFVEDLRNVMTVVLKLMFYMSGIFYSITNRVPAPYNEWMMQLNPMAFLLTSARGCMLYNQAPSVKLLLFWGAFGLFVSFVSVKILYKYENSYVKVI
ncbi:MAG: ABC transporter permease [Lachnospiraceae bacterium]|nr:ABC transporter permease [Lachnospiraceae bacterium]MCI9547431.1 ABC transporter permease [Lachnospiraceae bacterium]